MAVSTPIVLHAIGSLAFGVWVTLAAIVGYLGLAEFGFGFSVGRFVGEQRAKADLRARNEFLATIAIVYAAALVLVLLVSVGVAVLLPKWVHVPLAVAPGLVKVVMLLGLSIGLKLWLTVFLNILHTYQRLPLANGIRAGYALLQAALLIVAALAGLGLVGLALAMVGAVLVSCALALLLVIRIVGDLKLTRPSWLRFKQAVAYSGFMFAVSVGTIIVFQSDTVIIATFLGVGAVAAYAVALRVTQAVTQLINKVPDVLFPFYSAFWATGDHGRIREGFLLTARVELAGAAALVLGLGLSGRQLLAAWVGPNNVVATSVFAMALLLILLEAVIHPAAVLTAAIGGERPMAGFNNAEAAINLGLSISLVRPLGVLGVIAGTVIAQALTNLWWVPRWAMRRLGVSFGHYFRSVVMPCLLPAAMGAVAGSWTEWVWRPRIAASAILSAGVAVAIYLAAYWRWGLSGSDRDRLRAVVGLGRASQSSNV